MAKSLNVSAILSSSAHLGSSLNTKPSKENGSSNSNSAAAAAAAAAAAGLITDMTKSMASFHLGGGAGNKVA